MSRHIIKRVEFLGQYIPILLQNKNGPCPLLAIANVLLLRGHIKIPDTFTEVSIEQIIQLIATRIFDANSTNMSADLQKNIEDVISILPQLQKGLDVNVKFRHTRDYEFTREIAIFDILGINLFHGWLCNSDEKKLAGVIGSKSYNELVEKIINYQSAEQEYLNRENQKKMKKESQQSSEEGKSEEQQECDEGKTSSTCKNEKKKSLSEINIGTENDDENKAVIKNPINKEMQSNDVDNIVVIETNEKINSGKEKDVVDEYEKKDEFERGAISVSGDKGANKDTEIDEENQDGATAAEDEDVENQENDPQLLEAIELSRKAELISKFKRDNTSIMFNGKEVSLYEMSQESTMIQNFFSTTASQLTMAGLFKLHEEVKNNELCVFFRNNHFSTLLKRDGKIFLLLTDLGFEQQRNFVWEVLDGIDGDTTLATSKFKKAPPVANSEEVYDAAVNFASNFNFTATGSTNIHNKPTVTRQYSEEDDLALAMRLQEEERNHIVAQQSNGNNYRQGGNVNGSSYDVAQQQAELERLKQEHLKSKNQKAQERQGGKSKSGRGSNGCWIQ